VDKRLAALVYVHDPMCSWCYAFAPTLARLQAMLEDRVVFTRLLGGLAEDTNQAMPDSMQAYLRDTWQRIEREVPGTRFNHDFWRNCKPRRSTWPACRAVIAARRLDPGAESRMIAAIQHAYYRQARNPSEHDVLEELGSECGLDRREFAKLLNAADTHATLADEVRRSRQLGVSSFPSLRLLVGEDSFPITIDYLDAQRVGEEINARLGS
jgi:putative protein-disulfide isomerase